MVLQNTSCLVLQGTDPTIVKLTSNLKFENYRLSKGKCIWLFTSHTFYAKIQLAQETDTQIHTHTLTHTHTHSHTHTHTHTHRVTSFTGHASVSLLQFLMVCVSGF